MAEWEKKKKLILRYESLKVDPRTNIKTPHALKTPLVAAATENIHHIIHKRSDMRAKTMSEPIPNGSLAPARLPPHDGG